MRISDWSSDVCSSDLLLALVVAQAGAVLGRDDQRGRADRLTVGLFERHLALGVGLEERRLARMAVLGHPFEDTVCIIKRGGQQIGGLVRGVTVNDALIAGAFDLVAALVAALHVFSQCRLEDIRRATRRGRGCWT